jgi:hypothetical protein
MKRKELTGYVSSMGKYLDMPIMKDYKNTLYYEALSDATDRISYFINDENKSYQIIEISEIEDPNINHVLIEGIMNNNKITK